MLTLKQIIKRKLYVSRPVCTHSELFSCAMSMSRCNYRREERGNVNVQLLFMLGRRRGEERRGERRANEEERMEMLGEQRRRRATKER